MAPSRVDGAATNGVSSHPPNWIPIYEEHSYKPRKIKVITIGAGWSGLTMAHKVQNELKLEHFIEHVIYEKNPDIGGAWYENRYPGCACDIPAPIYTPAWEPNPEWSSYYAGSREIFANLKRVANKWYLTKNVKLNSNIVEARWDDNDGLWHLKIDQSGKIIEDSCNILVNGNGILNRWTWPNIPGRELFQGHMVHSASWDDTYDFTGKNVALIGNGSTGIQILPQIQKVAGKLTTFIRHSTWISANFLNDFAGPDGKNYEYTDEQRKRWKENPDEYYQYRSKLEHTFNSLFKSMVNGTEEREALKASSQNVMETRLGNNPDLMNALIPSWGVGCRRITPGDGYLEALQATNVEMVLTGVDRFTEEGLVDSNGQAHKFDAIICATGFDVTFRPRWPLIGRSGETITQKWKNDAPSYWGLTVDDFPNYVIIGGPYGPNGQGNFMPLCNIVSDYALKWAVKMAKEDIKSFEVKKEAIDDFTTYSAEFLKRTAWAEDCETWYKSLYKEKKILLWPGSLLHYEEALKELRGEDYNIKYNSGNRYRYFGNGLTKHELEKGNCSDYLLNPEQSRELALSSGVVMD